ncbi:peroxiredoxin Q/BCP [Epibacterium ulvae]|uniref:thioredoxin-dependent peroxiredoxin n=1 Tax=Epibacterium ulvae TaxID=1156985 RepID=A0A1G5RCB8_9RHOB|nr:thioredoxin-dependent thiol peroxidase [Epibacterium ulvae]SCZ71723.1 peroxiredoxin Q/BCP [Epibacterium ulvae]
MTAPIDLTAGDIAPDFTLPRDGGDLVSLQDLKGQAVVLFFYPRDDTPGCTKESIGFSESLDAFKESGATVFGLSRDTVAKHEKFIAKHQLTTPLLSAAEHSTCEDYGVWVEKNMYGRKSMGIERSTFLIDAEGKIARIWRKVKVPGHVEDVLQAVKEMHA